LKINELQNVLLGHGVILLFNICLGSPEIDFNWSSEAKDVGFMIVLDTFFGLASHPRIKRILFCSC